MVLSRKEKAQGIKFWRYNYEKAEIIGGAYAEYTEAAKAFRRLKLEGIGAIIKR